MEDLHPLNVRFYQVLQSSILQELHFLRMLFLQWFAKSLRKLLRAIIPYSLAKLSISKTKMVKLWFFIREATKLLAFNVILVEPEIPQNTGNIIRLCANVGATLHLVKPLGFELTDSALRRASLDYSDLTNVIIHDSLEEFLGTTSIDRIFATSSQANTSYHCVQYQDGDSIIFGSESVGLPSTLLDSLPTQNCISIPMMPANRSLNLSNAVAVTIYEMWRQLEFRGCRPFATKTAQNFS